MLLTAASAVQDEVVRECAPSRYFDSDSMIVVQGAGRGAAADGADGEHSSSTVMTLKKVCRAAGSWQRYGGRWGSW